MILRFLAGPLAFLFSFLIEKTEQGRGSLSGGRVTVVAITVVWCVAAWNNPSLLATQPMAILGGVLAFALRVHLDFGKVPPGAAQKLVSTALSRFGSDGFGGYIEPVQIDAPSRTKRDPKPAKEERTVDTSGSDTRFYGDRPQRDVHQLATAEAIQRPEAPLPAPDIAPPAPRPAPAPASAPSSILARFLAVARAEIGVTEIPGAEHNLRIVEYHATTTLKATTDEVPWCSSFANWVVTRAGGRGTGSAASRSWLQWGRPIDRVVPGCIAVFSRGSNPQSGHVGFALEDDGNHIHLLGGNQGNAVSIVRYPKSRLLSLRIP
jgi:uncharacterized protein (TIGR02594 family)